MVRFCGIINCSKRQGSGKSFFRLPSDLCKQKASGEKRALATLRREKWLNAIKRGDLTETKKKYLLICEDHFISRKPADLWDKDNPDWVPSLNLGYLQQDTSASDLARFNRVQQRNAAIDESATADEDATNEDNTNEEPDLHRRNTAEACVQTDLTMHEIQSLFTSHEDYVQEISNTKEKLRKREISEEAFEGDDTKVLYYTGLNTFSLLMLIFEDLIAPCLADHPNSVLTTFQQFMLTMMRLRLNLDFHDLSYRFSVCQPTVSRTFYKVIDIMYCRLQRFIVWPERHILQHRVPLAFQQVFGKKVTVIIDCFEITVEKPSNPEAQCQTWSNYKQRNTIKYLIGITPQGTISFISDAYGGRTPDKEITENCGILEKLVPHDLILADRGFDIQDSINLYCCEVEVPAFKKGKKQLSAIDIEETRGLASLRIHVERVIGVLRQKFRVLEGRMPISLVSHSSNQDENISTVDKIVTKAAALLNMCPPVIPYD